MPRTCLGGTIKRTVEPFANFNFNEGCFRGALLQRSSTTQLTQDDILHVLIPLVIVQPKLMQPCSLFSE